MLRDVYLNHMTFLLAMGITLLILNLIHILGKKQAVVEWAALLTSDEKRFSQLVSFEWYAVGYLLFDSISCVFVLPCFLLSVFLIGSCILLMIQFILFGYILTESLKRPITKRNTSGWRKNGTTM